MKINSILSRSDDNEFVSYFITSLSLYCWPHINQFIDCKQDLLKFVNNLVRRTFPMFVSEIELATKSI